MKFFAFFPSEFVTYALTVFRGGIGMALAQKIYSLHFNYVRTARYVSAGVTTAAKVRRGLDHLQETETGVVGGDLGRRDLQESLERALCGPVRCAARLDDLGPDASFAREYARLEHERLIVVLVFELASEMMQHDAETVRGDGVHGALVRKLGVGRRERRLG
jgi:hypothetical protein